MTDDATRTVISAGRILPDDTLLADRYRVVRLLGVGAMGMVYLARDQELGIDVALKVLRSGGDDERLERFRSELVLARQISHRNVVRIHDIGQSGDLTFITMDYVDGRSLKQRLETEGPLQAAEAVAIAIDLAAALSEAHASGIVHRDVKPANVMITTGRAYLTDFGIATSLAEGDGPTKTGEIIGTLDYLSPEQARGERVDGRADVYALGLLLHEMLTGRLPFTGSTQHELLAQRTLADPETLLAGSDDLPSALQPVIARCLAVDPDERYQDAAELAADLEQGGAVAGRRRRGPALGWRRVSAVAAAIALLSLAWQQFGSDELSGTPEATPERPLAVLPFEVALASGERQSIANGLAELLSENLAAHDELRIVPVDRVAATVRDLKLDVATLPASDLELLGDLLDAGYLVAGRLQQINATYRLEARLQQATTGELLHRVSSEVRDEADIFRALGPLAEQLLDNLDLAAAPVTLVPDGDSEVLRDYAVGVDRLTLGQALDAIEPLERAVASAPGFALAWDRLAQALAATGRDAEALGAADRAVRALPEQSGRRGALIRARRAALAGDSEAAIDLLEGLLIERPRDTEVRFRLAELYGDSGELESACTALERVVADSPDHPRAWYLLGKFSILRGDARRAADDYLVKALVIQNRLENPTGRADALNALGIASAQLGDSAEALDYYRRAVALRREVGDERGVAAVLANIARIEMDEGRYREAREGLIAARDVLAAIGDRWTLANIENELGFLEESRGRFEEALLHYREGLRLRRDLGDRRALAESYNNVAYTYYLLGDYDNAAVFNDQSTAVYRETGNDEGVMLAQQMRGMLEGARGRYDAALKAMLGSLNLARVLDNEHAEAVAEGYIGRIRHLQGHYATAAASFDKALSKLESIGDERGLAEFTLLDAELSLATGAWDAAAAAVSRATTLINRDDNPARRARQLRVEGMLLEATGDLPGATLLYREALARARDSGDRVAVLRARLAIAARGDAGRNYGEDRIVELRGIHNEASRMGHGELTFESSLALARAELALSRIDEADALLRAALLTDHAASGSRGDYRLYLLHADVLAAKARPAEADEAMRLAGAAVSRALDAQNEGQRRAFMQRPGVQRVLAREGEAHDIG